MLIPRRPSTFLRYLAAALLLVLTVRLLTGSNSSTSWSFGGKHPIDNLVRAAEHEFAITLARSTNTLPAAAAAYRKRRGRHPPPGFDKWYRFAVETHSAIIVEDFWDQIYHDLEPFWGIKPAQIRKDAREFEMRIEVRNHKASTDSDWFWTKIWLDMIQTVEHLLPDMDLAINAMDEPRIMVPWEEMDGYMKKAAETRKIADVRTVVTEFSKLPPHEEAHEETPEEAPLGEQSDGHQPSWEHDKHYWLIARRGCDPSSPARQAGVITDFTKPPTITSSFSSTLTHMKNGYVANYTLSTDYCHQPDLQALEGIFVEPLSTSTTRTLFPMFSGSKLSRNNDILLPAPIYWKEEERFVGAEGASIPWAEKHASAIWRGVATGGRNRETNWRAFQRHRFIAMNNASLLSLAASDPVRHPAPNFALPAKQYPLPPPHNNRGTDLPAWIAQKTDISFTDMMCTHDGVPDFSSPCDYNDPYFSPTPQVPLAEQFQHKFLPDIDGNSFSGRYLGFLRSTSLPIKAALWREWHDARLVAWKHFVPMDGRFGDWWGILAYFLGGRKRDRVAEGIAMGGREWAGRALRKEDMSVYVLRLLLEYARVVDDDREVMGWVQDLTVNNVDWPPASLGSRG